MCALQIGMRVGDTVLSFEPISAKVEQERRFNSAIETVPGELDSFSRLRTLQKPGDRLYECFRREFQRFRHGRTLLRDRGHGQIAPYTFEKTRTDMHGARVNR